MILHESFCRCVSVLKPVPALVRVRVPMPQEQNKREKELQLEYKRLQDELADLRELKEKERQERIAKNRKRGGIRPEELEVGPHTTCVTPATSGALTSFSCRANPPSQGRRTSQDPRAAIGED